MHRLLVQHVGQVLIERIAEARRLSSTFGVLVTRSYVAAQAYQEIKEDEHPIVIICANDIVRLLKIGDVSSEGDAIAWLEAF